jgi:hypothetical protein
LGCLLSRIGRLQGGKYRFIITDFLNHSTSLSNQLSAPVFVTIIHGRLSDSPLAGQASTARQIAGLLIFIRFPSPFKFNKSFEKQRKSSRV